MRLRIVAGVLIALHGLAAAASAEEPVEEPASRLLAESWGAYKANDPGRGYALLQRAERRARVEGQPVLLAESWRRLGMARLYVRDSRGAAELLRRSRTLFVAAGDLAGAGQASLLLARIDYERGDRDAAAAAARLAWDAFRAARDDAGQARAADFLIYLVPAGETQEALRREALALVGAGGRPLACGVLHELGDDLFSRGVAAEAFDRLNQARTCFQLRGERDAEARTLVSLGRVYRLHGRMEEALAHYQAAQTLHDWPGSPDPAGLLQALNATAVGLIWLTRYDEARDHLERALALARRSVPARVPFILANLGGLQLELGRYDDALRLLDEAFRLDPQPATLPRRLMQRATALVGLGRAAEALPDADRAVAVAGAEFEGTYARQVRARVLMALGRHAEAEADLRAVIAGIDAARRHSVPTDEMRRGFAEQHQAAFGAFVDLVGSQGRAADALDIAERARARAFLDLRAERVGAAAPVPATAADARRVAAARRSTIVSYWVGPTTLSIWVVRADREPALVRVPVRSSELASLAAAAGGTDGAARTAGLLVTDRAQRAPWRALERLLIAPIRHLLPAQAGSRLTIVPHGPLFGVSFAGLLQPSGRYLLETYDLHYVPAIATLAGAAPAPRAPALGALLIGDPGPIATEPGREPLPALPWARREVAAIRAVLPGPAMVLAGADATEARVRRAVAGQRVLHLATHGVVSNERGRPSFLAFHGAGDDDGRLSADEIYDLALDAELVVLSACRTALGPVEGDGVIGFTRAFLSAGARSVVATQWDVSDRASYDVMRGFYARRARGASTSRALRASQLALLDRLRRGALRIDGAVAPETPRLWAGFVLSGEP
jgi:CHAT domain-containing protein